MPRIQRDITFQTIRTEGFVLPADLLQRVAKIDPNLNFLTPQSYHLAENEKLNEAINRSWVRLLGIWTAFKTHIEQIEETDPAIGLTRDKWSMHIMQELGFGRPPLTKGIEIEGKIYQVSHIWQNVPIHMTGINVDLDKRTPGVQAAAKMSPHSLVQELLNRSDEYLWAFVTNGRKFRVLRDNATLTRQSYVEFDLEAMFDGEIYPDFVVFWMVCHQSRIENVKPEDFVLETWSQYAHEQGTRALDHLRDGVQKAIEVLGQGFLAHPSNQVLRDDLRQGKVSRQDYYRQVLRVIYRLIFLLVAEDRDLLFAEGAPVKQKERYTRHYSIGRLRQMADVFKGTGHVDLWERVKFLFLKLEKFGCPDLGLPALGSFLWAQVSTSELNNCQIENQHLLLAVRSLCATHDGQSRRKTDFRNLGPEELGSVYESLLELQPDVNLETAKFELRMLAGHERKTTGSYYTHSSLINCLLDSALEPVIQDTIKNIKDPQAKEKALLNLKICDPACGSGHFLIGAAHRLAKRLAAIRSGEDEPSPNQTRHAIRDVIGRCLYGVDINPMSVELCKVSLWMEALEPGKPLSFLDSKIKCGNSLLGVTPKLLKDGIPDEAFAPIIGDDKKVCSDYKKRNKNEREGQVNDLFNDAGSGFNQLGNLVQVVADLNALSDDDVSGVEHKEQAYHELVTSGVYKNTKLLCDAWSSAFVWKKSKEAEPAITFEILRQIEQSPFKISQSRKDEINRLANQYQFFHYHLEFPDVFVVPATGQQAENVDMGWNGGFDVVLGNPPWDKIQPEEEKFFSAMRPDIANASSAKIRKALIEALPDSDPMTHKLWELHRRSIDGVCHFLRAGGVLRFSVEGNLNCYRVFTELAAKLVSLNGKVGMIVQTGIATDESGKELFDHLLTSGRLERFLDFENRGTFFQDVHQQFRFCLITLRGKACENIYCQFGWLLHTLAEIGEPNRLVNLCSTDLLLFNPTSRTCPVFVSERDFTVSKQIYERGQYVSLDADHRLGQIDFLGELFNMTRDSALFLGERSEDSLRLYEAKYLHQFDHRFASLSNGNVSELSSTEKANPSCFVIPKSFVKALVVRERTSKRGLLNDWMAGFRSIASPTNERTSIFSVLPFSAVGNSINMVLGLSADETAFLMANANAYVFDFCARQKISGSNVNIWIFKQLPAISFSTYSQSHPWLDNNQAFRGWLLPRVLELTYTACDLQPFAKDCGYDGPPFKWDEERRFVIRCELDAAFFHLYGIERDDVDYIMETFPIVKRKDIAKHGTYRTKDKILELYDKMAAAIKTGNPFRSELDPPPGDPRAAHGGGKH